MTSADSETAQTHASPTDDALRRLAGTRLAQHLEIGAVLVARCEQLAMAARGDHLGPLMAAARLMQANAKVAETLAHVALVERRRRSIIEHTQTVEPKNAELISKKREARVGNGNGNGNGHGSVLVMQPTEDSLERSESGRRRHNGA